MANARTKARRSPSRVVHWVHARTGQGDDVERVEALPFWRPLKLALASYVAPRTICTLTFFRPGTPSASESHVRLVPGDEGTDECYVIDGPGVSHQSLMKEPHVRVLAKALTERLDGMADHHVVRSSPSLDSPNGE